ncbi:hypothetical protein [Streptomyces sp. NPDC001422]|uniref:hypothetical protein n=1 Tax=Streptomyces sp. NPDC001422 TaxID=3364575 RepID=UPI0036BFEEC3
MIRALQQLAGRPVYTDAEWAAALRAAQAEKIKRQHEQAGKLWEADERRRFVQPHEPVAEAVVPDLRGRESDRAAMNAFVAESGSGAPSYLCWYAEAAVGKSALLADYVSRPPRGADILNFFVSASLGADTRAEFEQCMVDQVGAFLGTDESRASYGARQWKQLFVAASEKSARFGRKLVLVVDGLDDDVAWFGHAVADGPHPSIAGRLPVSLPDNMRVIVSVRRWACLPKDLHSRHPLRRRKHLRALRPVEGVPLGRRRRPTTALGKAMADLLAVAGGGLRAEDMAECAGVCLDDVDRVLHGPEGRAFLFDEPIFQTYALAGPQLGEETFEALTDGEIARHAGALLAWSQQWSTASWPGATPPYPLMHLLRLLTDPAERAAYIRDPFRLRRLASIAGHHVALTQIEAFEAEVRGDDTDIDPRSLATLVELAAARAVLDGEAREVPSGAPALFVRLGEDGRARDMARFAPSPFARAVHLADTAVEMAYADRPEAEVLAHEAAAWLGRSGPSLSDATRDPATYARLLTAARTLVDMGRFDAARPLLSGLVHGHAVGIDELTGAAKILATSCDASMVDALCERADTLSQGSTRARAAAVDLWGAVAHAAPQRSSIAGDNIEAICDELTPSDGLGAVDVLAVAAFALAQLPARRHRVAQKLTRAALRQFLEALGEPDALSEDDRAHLRREGAGTLARLTRAVDETGSTRNALAEIEKVLASLPDNLIIGVLGDVIPERAQVLVEAGEERRAHQDRQAAADAKEAATASRQAKDEERRERKAERERVKSQRTESAAPSKVARSTPSSGRPRARPRLSMGVPPSMDESVPDHLRMLQEAEEHFHSGDLLYSRERLETALRNSPVAPARSPLPDDWTVVLARALGTAGEIDVAEELAVGLPGISDRVRHLAAVSLGASLGGHEKAAVRCAHEATGLLSDSCAPRVRNLVAQALAHAGEGRAAVSGVAKDTSAAVRRQALTAVAAGLAPHDPETAAHVAGPLVESLSQRISQGTVFRILPDLAALQLAYPDGRQLDLRLRETLRKVALSSGGPSTSLHAPSMAVLALLHHLGHFPEGDTPIENLIQRWQLSLPHGQTAACTELTVLAAVTGDTTVLSHHAAAGGISEERTVALSAAATHLAGAPLGLSADYTDSDRVARTLLALAHGSREGSPAENISARRIVASLLSTGKWIHAIAPLPQVAPNALKYLSEIAADLSKCGPQARSASVEFCATNI